MNNGKTNSTQVKVTILVVYIIGIICLVYFAIPFLRHDMSIANRNAMISTYSWDTCGFILTLGLIPLLIINILAFKKIDIKNKRLKLLFFIPSLLCLLLVISYIFMSIINESKNINDSSLVDSIKCTLNEQVYSYTIYKEKDNAYSVQRLENDTIPDSVIDYNSIDDIFNSIEKYYIDNGGMCP